jgi:amidase
MVWFESKEAEVKNGNLVRDSVHDVGRRDFLKWSAAVSLGGSSHQGPSSSLQQTRKPGTPEPPFELQEATIPDLQRQMAGGKLSARRLSELYLMRIQDLDRQGPGLRSIIEVNPEALAVAEALDRERKEKGPRGPLHGIPVVLKDNIDTHDRMTTTAGSLALEGSISVRDSFVAQRLRASGAVLLAKANLSEWANFRSDFSTSGWSARGGQCRNPYVLDRNPCGSSSGSAVAVSANLCPVAMGTETNGSIVCPSNANGVVGIKPTVGLVSRSGIIPIAHSQDTAGPIARTVADAAILLSALVGLDPTDSATAAGTSHFNTDYAAFLDPAGLRGARIGVVRDFFGFHERVDALLEEAIREMKRLGAVLVDPAELPNRREIGRHSFEVLLYEFKADLNAYFGGLGSGVAVRSLEELIAFNEKNRDREMPHFGQDLFVKAQAKGPLSTPEYREHLEKAKVLSGKEGIDQVMDKHNLDALVAPTGGPAWLTDYVNGDHFLGGSSSPAAVAGYPNITVPMGFVRSLPVGISFFGRAWSEPTLIRIAYAFEQAAKARKPPQFLPALEV